MSALGGYALVFGDVGYIKRQMMQKELVHLQSKISLLQAENRYLSEQYALSSSKKKSLSQKGKIFQNSDLTILKFEEESPPKPSLFSFFSDRKDRIAEARLLFIVIMLFLGSCGYLLLYRIAKKQRISPSQNIDE